MSDKTTNDYIPDEYCGECECFYNDGKYITGIDLKGETRVIADGVCKISHERTSEDAVACPLKEELAEVDEAVAKMRAEVSPRMARWRNRAK